jgi:hypothetical protein
MNSRVPISIAMCLPRQLIALVPAVGGGLNRSTQHFNLGGKRWSQADNSEIVMECGQQRKWCCGIAGYEEKCAAQNIKQNRHGSWGLALQSQEWHRELNFVLP